MNIHIISAHDDPTSLVGALHNVALGVLERAQHTVTLTELYAQQFNPVATKIDFVVSSGSHVNYMFEQQRAVNTGTGFSPDITAEMEKVSAAELLIIHFPLWWGGPPAILKGWFERILAMGFAWGPDARYERGLLRGKQVLLSVTVGDPLSYYSATGMHRASIEQHLYPVIHNTLAFCGFDIRTPFIVPNVTAAGKEELEAAVLQYKELLEHISDNQTFVLQHPTN
jgi:NAD(P)H dehydrogenase (quinone)